MGNIGYNPKHPGLDGGDNDKISIGGCIESQLYPDDRDEVKFNQPVSCAHRQARTNMIMDHFQKS
jgi:hypothetical protein